MNPITSDTEAVSLANVRYAWAGELSFSLHIRQFSVQRGEKLFIKGPSGSGKTTLLGLIGGVLQPSEGSLHVLGTNLGQLGSSKRDAFRANHIGFIFQMFNLLPYLDVLQNVLLPCRFSKLRSQKMARVQRPLVEEAQRLLERLGLAGDSYLSRKVTALSVGQQQRVAAARALLGSPEILIADEPTSALDFDSRESFVKLLFEEVKQAGTTLIFVSHDATLAKLFDRTVSLQELNEQAGAQQQ